MPSPTDAQSFSVKRAEEASRIRVKGQWEAAQAGREKFGEKVAEYIQDQLSLDERIAWLRERYADEEQREREQHDEQVGVVSLACTLGRLRVGV